MLNEKGVTLVELMVAMMIGIIGFLGMMTVQITSMSATTLAKNETAAVNLAQGLLEKFTFKPYTAVALYAGSGHPWTTDVDNGVVPANPILPDGKAWTSGAAGTRFTRTWSVVDNYNNSGQKMVTVEVKWGEAQLGEKKRTFRMLKSQFY